MATSSLLYLIAMFLIINIDIIEGQRASWFPRIQRFISKPESDLDDYDDIEGPFGQLPFGPGPIPPMPLIHSPYMGGLGSPLGFNPMARLFPTPYQQHNPYFNGFFGKQQRQEEIFTAIGYDRFDPNSQMRITIIERRPQGPGMVNPILGGPFFPGDDDFSVNYDAPTNWYVQGTFFGSQMRNKAGTYHLVVTQSGRTADGCASESLGPIVSSDVIDINFNNPFMQNSPTMGIAANQVLVGSAGPTVFASSLDGLSRRQLVGSGLAACQYINNGVCGGQIPFCATISKDLLPSMEVPLATNAAPAPRTMTFDPFDDFRLQTSAGGELTSFAEQDRSASFNSPQALARQAQDTGSSDALGLLF